MIVAVDSSVLLHLIDPNLSARPDPATGSRPEGCQARVDELISRIGRQGGRLVIPTPVLSEVLVRAGPVGADWLAQMSNRRGVRIAPFDQMAAVECAALAAVRLSRRERRGPRAKAKFDEQIVAIAVVEHCDEIISDDTDIAALAPASIAVRTLADLPLPPLSAQISMDLDTPSSE